MKFISTHRCHCAKKGIAFSLLLLSSIVLNFSCSVKINPVSYKDETDPENPYFIPPDTYLITNFLSGDTLTTQQISLAWVGSVPDSCVYFWTLDSVFFSGWTYDTMAVLPLLDEGDHYFEIIAKYFNGVMQDTSTRISYYVDAIPGPALRLSPPYQEITKDEDVRLDVWLEDVQNWTGGQIILTWDHTYAQFDSLHLYDLSYQFLSQQNSVLINRITDYPDSVILDMGLVDADPTGISGSGKIARLVLRPVNNVDTLDVNFGTGCEFRDAENQSILILEMAGGTAVVTP